MRLGNIMGGFAAGVPLGMKMSDAFDEAKRRKELADAATAQPEQQAAFTADQGQQLEAAANAKDAEGNPLYQVGYEDAKGYTVAPTAGGDSGTVAPVTKYRMGGKEQETPFTPAQIGMQRAKSMSDVALRHGDPVQATRFETLAATRRDTADQEEIRSTLDGTAPVGLSHVRPFVNDKGGAPMSVQGDAANSAAPGMQRQGSYLETVGPRVMDAYLKQGKIAEAKAWRDFTESESGHAYANDFSSAQRLVTVGDYDTAAPILEKLYNRGYPDGRQVKLTSLGDGQYKADVFDQKSGQLLGSKTMPAPDMGKMAISALAPTKLVEFMSQQQGKREAEGSTLNRQLELERLRQEGADVRDDRREERLQTRLDAQSANLERRLSAGGGLTAAQHRSNAEIDAAREAVAGMSPQEIMRRTAKTSNTGRENRDYDPALARQAGLANRRKIGDDESFDSRQNRQQSGDTFGGKPVTDLTEDQLQQFGRSAGADGKAKIDTELARRSLAGMPAMQGHRIGQYVEGKGYQVLDPQGRPVSYLRRKQ